MSAFILQSIGAAVVAAWLLRWWFTPWAKYVSHSVISPTKRGGYETMHSVTVNHRAVFFGVWRRTYTRKSARSNWVDVETGDQPRGWTTFVITGYGCKGGNQLRLDGILEAALIRDAELKELMA